MNILFIGDVVGSPGREAVRQIVPLLQKEYSLDFVIANAENAAGGSGITAKVAQELFSSGVSVLTAGDHIWKKPEIFQLLDQEPRIVRPLNFPLGAPGKGASLFTTAQGVSIGVISILGRVFMDALECPFRTCKQAREELAQKARVIIVDVHAEATSEKIALGWFLDGSVSAIIGTHTHIQTADEKILPGGSAYITDAGMTGPYHSVIGRRIEDVLDRFITAIPVRFEVAKDDVQLHGVVVSVDENTGIAQSITRVQRRVL
jgi:2',3'-cyclic-nucleotide 2'-phosphodiesterase